MLKHKKMLTWEELDSTMSLLKQDGKKIVFTNGCFDILHPGHVDLLARAKALGDVLILGLNSDASVKRQGKGDARPFNSYEARAFVLAHLASIDFVVCFDDDTPLNLIEKIVPHVLVKGGDWEIAKVVGRECVEKHGGQVFSLSLIEGFSTTALANSIANAVREGLL